MLPSTGSKQKQTGRTSWTSTNACLLQIDSSHSMELHQDRHLIRSRYCGMNTTVAGIEASVYWAEGVRDGCRFTTQNWNITRRKRFCGLFQIASSNTNRKHILCLQCPQMYEHNNLVRNFMTHCFRLLVCDASPTIICLIAKTCSLCYDIKLLWYVWVAYFLWNGSRQLNIQYSTQNTETRSFWIRFGHPVCRNSQA